MEFNDFHGIYLKKDEKVVMEAKPAKLALIVTWLSIPGVFFILFLIIYLPQLLRMAFSKAAKAAAMEALGVSSMEQVNVGSYVWDLIWGNIPTFLIVLICIPIVILVLVWFVWCLVMTYRHLSYCLAITDIRVIGKARGTEMTSPLNEVVNVFMERSLWAKIFGYGSIVVHTKSHGAQTFHNIANPKEVFHVLMNYASNYCAH